MSEEGLVDVAKLPEKMLFDTGILIRALGARQEEFISPACVAIFKEMTKKGSGRSVIVAAPTVAELLRHPSPLSVPVHKQVIVVSLDGPGAKKLGEVAPETFLVDHSRAFSQSHHYVKYDALIVACGSRAKATAAVSLDRGFRALAEKFGMTAFHPGDLISGTQFLPGQ